MEYYTADSYKNWERVGEPYTNDKGKLVTDVKCDCPRCGGFGIIISRVENNVPIPIPVDQGVCYQCLGKKYLTKTVRLYTEKEYNTMQKVNERTKQKKEEMREEKRKAEFGSKKAKWLADNNFDEEGNTYIYVYPDSYDRKDELKAAGFKYNPILLWHRPTADGFEENVEKHKVEEFYELTAWGTYTPYADAASKVRSFIEAASPASDSTWIGSIGGKLKEIKVKLTRKYSFETSYGVSTAYNFVTEDGNVLVWFSSTFQNIEPNQWTTIIHATIKDHSTYKNVKQTILTRCKLKLVE